MAATFTPLLRKTRNLPRMMADADSVRKAGAIYEILCATYPDVHCELNFADPLQLLVATVLSAQCTDKRVNAITPALFRAYPYVESFARADLLDLEALIRSAGFFRAKSRSIKGLAMKIVTDFQGEVPRTLDELVSLPGVGRKTANVVLGHAFGVPGITVDTHFGRLSRRFHWTTQTNPVKVESEVGELIPQEEWTNLSQRMIWHGRRICHARRPACGVCPVAKVCPSVGIGEMDPDLALALVKQDSDFQ